MPTEAANAQELKAVITAEQIQKRIREMARQISNDYRGKTLHALGLLENSFMFMADLVRLLDVPVICQFVKPRYKQVQEGGRPAITEIFFSHEIDIRSQHVLLIEGIVHSGVTSEYLVSDLRQRGAGSVKVATLLDRQAGRRVPLQPDYFGFLVDGTYLVGYGLGSPQMHRNLPYLAAGQGVVPVT
jgi:hypoxanthine phosphoribosyltransferase